MSTRDEDTLLTVRDVADHLAISPVTVRRRIACGELHALRIGPSPNAPVRIARDDLIEFVTRSSENR